MVAGAPVMCYNACMKKPIKPIDADTIEKLEAIRKELRRVPFNDGQHFAHVALSVGPMSEGTITFGIQWKTEMGEDHFSSLDEVVPKVKALIERMHERSAEANRWARAHPKRRKP